jgi:hypothetical protein
MCSASLTVLLLQSSCNHTSPHTTRALPTALLCRYKAHLTACRSCLSKPTTHPIFKMCSPDLHSLNGTAVRYRHLEDPHRIMPAHPHPSTETVTLRIFLTKININSPTNKPSQAAVRIPVTSHIRHNTHPATAHNRVEHTL